MPAGLLAKYSSLLALSLILLFCVPSSGSSIMNSSQLRPVGSGELASNLSRVGSTGPKYLASSPTSQSDPYNQTLKLKIAAVEPVFTTTAYFSFYSFYNKYASRNLNGTIKTDLNLLNASIVQGWGWSDALRRFLTSTTAGDQYDIVFGRNLSFITEVNVTEGALFRADGTRNYDVLILGFTEYVTVQEYYAYKSFVTTGGVLVLMDATNFLAQVEYYPRTQHLALIKGHGWSFNGTVAKHDIFNRWRDEDTNWIGSTFGVGSSSGAGYDGAIPLNYNPIGRALMEKYGAKVFTKYQGHEENIVTNLTRTSIIANWVQTRKPNFHPNVATYLHSYGNGLVAHLGVMGSDVILSDDSVQFFLAQTLLFASGSNIQIVDPPATPPSTTIIVPSGDTGTTYSPPHVGDVVLIPRRNMVMSFLVLGLMLLISFLAAAIWLRKREHGTRSSSEQEQVLERLFRSSPEKLGE